MTRGQRQPPTPDERQSLEATLASAVLAAIKSLANGTGSVTLHVHQSHVMRIAKNDNHEFATGIYVPP